MPSLADLDLVELLQRSSAILSALGRGGPLKAGLLFLAALYPVVAVGVLIYARSANVAIPWEAVLIAALLWLALVSLLLTA